MMLDCCGGAAIYENARALFGMLEDRLEFRILLSSSKRGESSWEIRGRGSPFTHAVIEALLGHMPGIGKQGEIYFTSLMAHVTSRVAELLASEYSGLPPQHPSFEGSFEMDPLLFVNSDIAIGRLVLKTARYSAEYVRRRVRQAVVAIVAGLVILVTGYWTWLDQHYFLRFVDNSVALYHGYSNFPWPGMPKPLWQFGIYKSLLDPKSELAAGEDLNFLKGNDVSKIFSRLEPNLTTTGKIYLATQLGQTEKARRIAKQALDANDPTVTLAGMLDAYVRSDPPVDESKALYASIIKNDKIGIGAALAFQALVRIDANQAIELIKGAPTSRDPNVLFGVRALTPPCSDRVRSYLFFKLIKSEEPYVAEFGMNAALEAQCRSSATPFYPRSSFSQAKTFGYFNKFQSDAYRKLFFARVQKAIDGIAKDGWKKDDLMTDWNSKAIEELAFSGGGPCEMSFLIPIASMPPGQQLDIVEYLLNSCPNLSYDIIPQIGGHGIEFLLKNGGDDKAKVLLDFDDGDKFRDRALDFIQRRDKIEKYGYLIDEPIAAYVEAWKTHEASKYDLLRALNALKWAVQLKYWSPDLEQLLKDIRQPEAVRKWTLFAALRAVPRLGTEILIKRYADFNFDSDGLLKIIVASNLPADSISEIRGHAAKQGLALNLPYMTLTALYGTTDEVVALLSSPNASNRAAAWQFVQFRDDITQIEARLRRNPPVFDPGMPRALNRLRAEQENLQSWLAAVPDWALDWRIFIAARLYGPLSGFSLKHLAAINSRKERGIERPFIDNLLKFSWQ